MDPIDIPGRAVFVKLNEYKDIIELIDALKQKLVQAKSTLEKIRSLKTEEETEIELWESSLGEIDKKIANIDRALFENEASEA